MFRLDVLPCFDVYMYVGLTISRYVHVCFMVYGRVKLAYLIHNELGAQMMHDRMLKEILHMTAILTCSKLH